MLRILTISLCILTGAASGEQRSDENLKASLIAMRYQDVSLDGCLVSYSREVSPNKTNNGFYRITRIIYLNNFDDIGDQEVERISNEAQDYFVLAVPYNRSYRKFLDLALRFRLWSMSEFPSSNWPHEHPTHQNENSSAIEGELQRLLPNISKMNRQVAFTKYGAITSATMQFRTNHNERLPLENLKYSLIAYSRDQGCN
ncbi:hypothetical protein [Parasedimentitalea marina]|uniref:hypothetical protein n=1 Tax=Parasedimentitalea marina TaxID=2483033 RepID=UPI000FD81739|nr:hypothetical protein [Parasedimentitalea marina]